MTAAGRLVWRSHDRRVTVSWPEERPVRLSVRELDGTTGQVDLLGLYGAIRVTGRNHTNLPHGWPYPESKLYDPHGHLREAGIRGRTTPEL